MTFVILNKTENREKIDKNLKKETSFFFYISSIPGKEKKNLCQSSRHELHKKQKKK